MRTVTATRYVAPLREGGSVPALVEADDDGLYVVKLHGAGQGPRALIAELLVGEIGRALGLPVPEITLVDLDPVLGRSEPDPELQAPLVASGGLNLGLDFLPGAFDFNPLLSPPPDAALASAIVLFDAYTTNVDRTAHNPNMLVWHKNLYLIDHGAALYFHHSWQDYATRATAPFPQIKSHVLLPLASAIPDAADMFNRLRPDLLHEIVALIPDAWLGDEPQFATADDHRAAYTTYLIDRLAAKDLFVQEALDARDRLV